MVLYVYCVYTRLLACTGMDVRVYGEDHVFQICAWCVCVCVCVCVCDKLHGVRQGIVGCNAALL